MPFGFSGKKEEVPFRTDITNKDELDEIKKIAERLDPDETVLVVAKQSRGRPGGSVFTPNVVFATDKRLLLLDPSALGLRQSIEDIPYEVITSARLQKGVFSSSIIIRAPGFSTMSQKRLNLMSFAQGSDEGEIEAISKEKAEQILEIIKKGIEKSKLAKTTVAAPQSSIADELKKLAALKAEGVISEAEFQNLKADLMSKKI